MNVSDCMKRNVVSVEIGTTIRQVIALVVKYHIGTVPVVDDKMKLVGVVRLRDLLSLGMPDFVKVLDNFEFVHTFGAMETRHPAPEDLSRRVEEIMETPVYAKEDYSLLHAAAILHHQGLKDLPVITKDHQLVGIASHVDIGTALMSSWYGNAKEPL